MGFSTGIFGGSNAGQFHASVYTPSELYLKYATVTSWIVNGGVAYPPASSDTVRLHQWTRSCWAASYSLVNWKAFRFTRLALSAR